MNPPVSPTRSRRHRMMVIVAVGALALTAVACGSDDDADVVAPPTSPTVDAPDTEWDEARIDEARENARGLLGMNEADLPDDVRIARRGEEEFMLTMDYVIGRRTVELDDVDGSGFRVVTVTIELPEQSESFDLQPG